MNAELKNQIENVILEAEKALAKYPQYADHFRTPDWKPVRIKRDVRTKFGLAFAAGDVTLARSRDDHRNWFAWSFRNTIDTSIEPECFEVLPTEPVVKTVGRFTIEGETVTGPAQYMKEQGNAKLERICAGRDQVFNMSAHLSPDVETAILVHLQTDYAGWKGAHDLFGAR